MFKYQTISNNFGGALMSDELCSICVGEWYRCIVDTILTCFLCCVDVWYLSPLLCVFFLALIPLWVVVARKSPQNKEVLVSS